MSDITQEQVEEAIKGYVEPHMEKDLVSAKCISKLAVDGDKVKVELTPYDLSKGRITYRTK